MAGDLRTISAAIHIVTDLERMGDHAAGIAKIVIETANEPCSSRSSISRA